MGIVYKAEDVNLKRLVAIKALPRQIGARAEERERFKIEAQAAAALNHPNIATIYAIEEVNGELFIVMEYIDGRELKQLLIDNDQLTIDHVLDYAMQVAAGLQAAHEKGITHRDLKPANVMITQNGVAKILDFGVAKLVGQTGLTKTGGTVGTVAYMSPEQTRGAKVDHRTDIWALGVVLYEMITGQLPFKGEYEAAVMYSIWNEEPPPITDLRPEVPPALTQIVARALGKQAEDRYQTMADLLIELQKAKRKQQEEKSKEQAASATPERPSTKSAVAERRQVTVLACQLMASSTSSESLDPEELHALLPQYQSLCAKVITRYEGQIIQSFGDSLLVYFGYPHAHEDDPRRAVHAGLGILEGLRQMNSHLKTEKEIKLVARVGIHTGLVVAGDVQAMVGETPSLATQLQNFADPDALVISQATFRLIEGYFDCRELGMNVAKGVAQPIPLYQVLYTSAARSRLEAARVTGLTPLVGRAKEIGMLQERWEQVIEGNGQVVLLNGEAGIGKSRLVQELKEHVAANPQAWLTECYCSPYHQSSALYPLIELLKRVVLQFEAEDAGPEKLRKLEGFLVQYGLALPETTPLFVTLLSIPLSENYPPLNLSPQQQKQKILEALLSVLLTRASQQPLLFVMEDVHWADPSTLELLNLFIDQAPTTKLCILLTFRPDFTPPWEMRSYLTYITLSRLPRKEIENMVVRVTKGKALPEEVLNHIASKTDGVPLFVEEMTKMVLESGMLKEKDDQYELVGSLTKLTIPTTLRDSLMARLDRLATAKEVAQLAAVLGREFPYEWLRAVSPLDEATLNEELTRLVNAELLYRRGLPPNLSYIFKHALIQDAAYESLLKSTRQQYHRQFAEILATKFSEIAETQPELLAHHYTEAGLKQEAIDYWQKAGRRAIERSANIEAVSHLTNGIELLNRLQETPEHLQQELDFQTALGPALMAIKGYSAPEVEHAYNRARELCQKVGETPQLFSTLWGVWYFYGVRPESQKAVEVAEQLLTLARSAQDSTLLMVAQRALGAILIYRGELAQGLENLKQAIALYNPQQHRPLAFVYGQDIGVICKQWSAWALWILGYPDQALKMNLETIQMAHGVSHPLTLAYVLWFSAMFYQFRRQRKQAKELAEQALRLSTDQGFVVFNTASVMVLGMLAEEGEIEKGIARTREGIAAWRATGAELFLPYHLARVADAYGRVGQIEEGLAALSEALVIGERSGEHAWDAEVYRIKGELLLMQGADESDAEACFHQALEIARRQSAKSFELRAAMSLTRLLKRQGKTEEARTLLAEIYGWFTEGFDTVDLQEAKALLEQWA